MPSMVGASAYSCLNFPVERFVGRAPSPAAGPLTGLVSKSKRFRVRQTRPTGASGRGSGDPPHKNQVVLGSFRRNAKGQ